MNKSNLLTPRLGVSKGQLLLSAYSLATMLVREHPGEGSVILEITSENGLLCYWVGLDTEPGPNLTNAHAEILLWVAPTECWPADATSCGLATGQAATGGKDGGR